MELFQAEWCPHSHAVRERLTELGIDFQARQVSADPEERDELERIAGTNEIPVLVPEDRDPVCGEDDILAYLDERYEERADAAEHRAKAREEVREFAEVKASRG
ncbi:MAG TPA: glutaredoxin [Gaiellaceae bacterium]|jgi:glutathione S-transferase